MFYSITHKLHNDDLGAIIEADSKDEAFKILFNKGNFGEEHQRFLLVIEEFSDIGTPLSKVKYQTLSNKRRGKRDPLIIQWYKGWGESLP
jgi:hypothetical protein